MSKKRGIILAAGLLAVLGGLLWLLWHRPEPEPVYQGKRLSAWLEAGTNPTNAGAAKDFQNATNAVHHIGTNAIPTLLRMLRARDSALTLKLLALAQKQPFLKIHYVRAYARNNGTIPGFYALGAEAKDAVPTLVEIYEQNFSFESRVNTLFAIGAIGPDAKAAIPLLVQVMTNTSSADQNATVFRRHAAFTLRRIHAEPALVVPALTKALSDPDARVRQFASETLGDCRTAAKPAVPELFKLLEDQDPMVGQRAAEAIRKIDPQAAVLRRAELDAAKKPPGPIYSSPPQTPAGRQ